MPPRSRRSGVEQPILELANISESDFSDEDDSEQDDVPIQNMNDKNVDDEDEDDDEDDEDDEDEESEEEVIERRVLPERKNRGSRMAELMAKGENENEANEFWDNNKEVFMEDEIDSDFSDTDLLEDIVDADFDLSEVEVDEEDEKAEALKEEKAILAKERKPVKSGTYVDPALARKRAAAGEDIAPPVKRVRKPRVVNNELVELRNRPQRRAAQLAEEARMVKLKKQKERKIPKQRVKTQYRELTQEEQFAEAYYTEMVNKSSLEELLRIEEQAKKIVERKPVHQGPTIVYKSSIKDNRPGVVTSSVVFNNSQYLNYIYSPTQNDYVEPKPSTIVPKYNVLLRSVYDNIPCVVTGAPAKYRDPLTKLPFSTLNAQKDLHDFLKAGGLKPEEMRAKMFEQVPVSLTSFTPDYDPEFPELLETSGVVPIPASGSSNSVNTSIPNVPRKRGRPRLKK